ncbi:MAG: DUF58 domain-containing protein [Oscillospiraceae bacterium]|nr:DUF58 domain-containing protein [Oscillospiraceae bacterium]
MIWAFLIILLLGVVFLQQRLAPAALHRTLCEFSCDRILTEPEASVCLTTVVRNIGRLPILYLSLLEYLPGRLTPLEDEAWCRRHLKKHYDELCCDTRMFLMPHRRCEKQFRFSFPERGSYQLGKYYLETGDFLGAKSTYRDGEINQTVVVMPRLSSDPGVIRILGGFLGEISVRRFLYEDPVLTVGAREYTGHEPMKRISWQQTARTGQLQVKEYDYTVDANVTVLLNMDRGSEEDLETCFQITRSVCEELERRRIPYEFDTNGDLSTPQGRLSHLAEGLGSQHLRTILYGLGTSRCRGLGSLSDLVHRCLGSRKQARGYILITPALSEQDQASLTALRRASDTELCLLTGRGEDFRKGGSPT